MLLLQLSVFHIHPDLIQDYKIDSAQLRPVARLGGPNYAGLGPVISQKSIFQTPKTVIK